MKIYDCFCYFNEDMLLELRFETLWDYVDYFVITEASYTHAGNDRKTQFDISKFTKYESKIRYLQLDQRPPGHNDFWKNENFIRNNIANGLFDANPEDLILISDLDEIPRPEKISLYDRNYIRGDFDQSYYSYYLNNLWIGDVDKNNVLLAGSNIWRGSKITTYNYFINFFKANATSVRSYKSIGIFRSIKREWFKRFNVQLIENGGWHFTWVFSLDDIVKKLESTAHQEFNDVKRKDFNYIKSIIESGCDLNKPSARYKKVTVDSSFPKAILSNKDRYSKFILD